MKILFVTWELPPFFHVGGLGDVSRSLPKALHNLGVDIRIILPYYEAIKVSGYKIEKIKEIKVKFDGKDRNVSIFQTLYTDEKIPVYFIENSELIDVPSKDTFPFFNLAIVQIVKDDVLNWCPDVIHCNDLHAGFIPFLVKHKSVSVKILFTIHNLNHQGKQPISIINKMGMDPEKCRIISWEISKKQINTLLEAVIHADFVNTVSPTYADEILTEEFGSGLEDILGAEERKITGIINGIDYEFNDPKIDKNLSCNYGLENYTEGKRLNKELLQKKTGLEVIATKPLIGFVGRFTEKQKGIELIHKMLTRIDINKYQFIFLGKGDENWEQRFLWFMKFFPKNVYCDFEFNGELASEIYAASDFLLIPSRFEPCGLIQMIAMRYGTLPIARATGGLKDTIDDGTDGYLFKNYSSVALEKRLDLAVDIWKNRRPVHDKMIENAMKKDFSWGVSAKKYLDLYETLLKNDNI